METATATSPLVKKEVKAEPLEADSEAIPLVPAGSLEALSGRAPSPGLPAPASKASKVKRPMNSFLLFSNEMRPILQAQHKDQNNAQISKLLGQQWKALSASDKAAYVEAAARIKSDFTAAHPDYVYTKTPRKHKKRKLAAEKDYLADQQQSLPAPATLLSVSPYGLPQFSASAWPVPGQPQGQEPAPAALPLGVPAGQELSDLLTDYSFCDYAAFAPYPSAYPQPAPPAAAAATTDLAYDFLAPL